MTTIPDSNSVDETDDEIWLSNFSEKTFSDTLLYTDKKNKTFLDRIIVSDLLRTFAIYFWRKKPYKYGICKKEEKLTTQRPVTDEMWFLPNGENVLTKLHNTAKTLKSITNSAGYILYIVSEDSKELFICPKKWESFYYNRFSWKIRIGKTIATYVAKQKEAVIVDTTDIDIRFPRGQELGHLFATDIIAVPLINFEGTCMGVLELYRENEVPYEKCHLKIISFILKCAGEAIHQNKEKILYDSMSTTSHTLLKTLIECFPFVANDNFTNMFYQKAMVLAQTLTNAESAAVFVIKNYDVVKEVCTRDFSGISRQVEKMIMDKEILLANLSLKSGWIVNLPDVYNDRRFDREVDIQSGYLFRSVLEASFVGRKHLVGILQLLNKISGTHQFLSLDEMISIMCANFCAFWYYYEQLRNENILQTNINKQLEDFLYYLISKDILEKEIFDMDHVNKIPDYLTNYSFYSYPKHMNDMPKLLFIMFNNACKLNLNDLEILYNFIYMTKKCYRPRPYYNFEIFFMCTQFIFALICESPDLIDNNEKISLMIAMICAGVDMKGETLEYLEVTKDPILQIYNDSPLERHAIRITKMLLKISGILRNLSNEDQQIIKNMIDENILALNFRNYTEIHVSLASLIAKNQYDWKNPEHRMLTRATIMTAARLCIRCKPVPAFQRGLNMVFDEILQQEERCINYYKCPPINDPLARRREIYGMFCKIMETADIPFYETIKRLFPNLTPLYQQAINNYRLIVHIYHSELNILDAEATIFKESIDFNLTEEEEEEEEDYKDDIKIL